MMSIPNKAVLLVLCFCVSTMYLFNTSNVWADSDISNEQQRNIEEVKQLAIKWVNAYQSGDIETLMSLYTEDTAIFISNKISLRGLKEIRDYFEPRLGAYEFDVTVKEDEFLVHGELIIHFSLVWIEGRNVETDQPFSDAVRSMVIFRHSPDTGWRIYLDMDQHTKDTDRPIGGQ